MNTQTADQAIQHKKDSDHLTLIFILHLVAAGLCLAGLGFLAVHFAIMNVVFSNPALWKSQTNAPPFDPTKFWHIFVWFYVLMGIALWTAAALNGLSGIFLRRRRHRVFSIVIAAINCLQFPLGTALGVFTMMVLMRPSVQDQSTQALHPRDRVQTQPVVPPQ
jgi:hypothetical protein